MTSLFTRIVAVSALALTASIVSASPTTRPTVHLGGITRGPVAEKKLSVVFTGGDFAEGVPTILRVCAERKIPASFFVTGDFLRLHPDAAKSIIAAGHLLGPHGHGHLLYCDWGDRNKSLVTREQFEADLKRNQADLAALGAKPSPYFLPAFEWYNAETSAWTNALGLSLINFTPGSGSNRDYLPEGEPKFQSSAEIADGILAYEQRDKNGLNGFLLLLHAGSKRVDKMHTQFDRLFGELQRRGYTFVTVDTLLAVPPATQPTAGR